MTAIARVITSSASVLLIMFLIAQPYVLSTRTIVRQIDLRNREEHQPEVARPEADHPRESITTITETEIVQGKKLPLV